MRKHVGLVTTLCLLGACGGGGSGGGGNGGNGGGVQPPPPAATTQEGRFKDSNVHGLGYTSATQSGTTDENGKFDYVDGETVEFSIGAIVIGSTRGNAIVTPVDLVPTGSSSDQTVTNIVRFLMMLDQNDDPIDGIEISAAVEAAAANWVQPDFSSTTFANDIVSIISDVASVDNRAAALPAAQQAQLHLESTERCLMSGLYSGEMSGAISGDIYLLVSPHSGAIKAAYPGTLVNFESETATPIDRQRNFRLSNSTNPDDNFEGRFDSYDQLSGVWTVGTDTGTFTATRMLADLEAAYRYTGEWYANSVTDRLQGVQVFNVDGDGKFDGVGPRIAGNRYNTTGSIDGNNITMRISSSGTTLAGTIDAGLKASLTGVNSNRENVFSFAEGCRLN